MQVSDGAAGEQQVDQLLATFLHVRQQLGRASILRVHVSIQSVEGGKEGSVLFNDTLNTFYLRLYSVGHMVKDHSDSERGKEGRKCFI